MGAFLGALENVGAPLPLCQRLGPAPAPDDLIVGSSGSTGEVEAICIPLDLTADSAAEAAGRRLPLCPSRHPPQSVAACLSIVARRILSRMGTKSRETIYGASVRAAAERATEARKEADRLACEAWNKRMLGFQGPAQPSPALGDAINAGFGYLEVKCLGCNTHQTVALDIVRRPKATPIHELERYMRCKDCSEVRGYPYKRSHLVALRATKITASDPPSTWWPGER